MDPSKAAEAIALNNQGSVHLSEGRCASAVSLFSRGLELVKGVLLDDTMEDGDEEDIDDEEDDDDDESMDDEAEDTLECVFVKIQQRACETMKESSTTSSESSSRSAPHVFSNQVEVVWNAPKLVSFDYYMKLSHVLLFNLGLSHHLIAVWQESMSPKRLNKALSLYELAYTLQVTEDLDVSMLQTMAIVNNLGSIHAVLGNQEKSDRCFRSLLTTIMFLKHYGSDEDEGGGEVGTSGGTEGTQSTSSSSQCIPDEFLGNVMPFIVEKSALAPAA